MSNMLRLAAQRLTQARAAAAGASRATLASSATARKEAGMTSHNDVDHGHGHHPMPMGAKPRHEAGLAYTPPDVGSGPAGNKAVSQVRDGGDIDWNGVQLPSAAAGKIGLFGPGAKDGEVPTDFEQSTGRERFELMYRMAGVDPWHMGELQVPYAGTMKNPVFVWASNPFRIVGCTGYPKDSHDRKYMRVRMGPIATRCTECGTAYALDYCGPFRNEHGRLLSLAPGATPEDLKFVEDHDLHHHDAFRADVELDFAPQREGRAYAEHRRWEGWHKGETPDDWELLHADEATRKEALEEKARDDRPIAWWDAAKGNPHAANATEEKPKSFWGSYLLVNDPHAHH